MSDLPEDGQEQLLLFAGLLQEELGTDALSCHLSCHPHLTPSLLQSTHKTIHKSNHNPFPTYPYTGSLRPVYPLSLPRTVPDSIKLPDHARDGNPRLERVPQIRNKHVQLDAKQQEAMRKVCRLGREILDLAAAAVKPGVTTDYIDEIVHKATIERDVCLNHLALARTLADRHFRPTLHR